MSPVLVVGGAACVWRDLAAALDILPRSMWRLPVIAVNEIGCYLPRVDHWASRHGELFADHMRNGVQVQGWSSRRARAPWAGDPPVTWGTPDRGEVVDRVLDQERNGSSGLFGVEVALTLGHTRIILCGIPMTRSPHFTGGPDWEPAPAHLREWREPEVFAKLKHTVRSMSGETEALFGRPTVAWLHDRSEEAA